MASRPPGRHTESLFDNRYRYDYIYPRGRSGETLRAYDTLDQDRPVVIKRPAPQDAPPMRAGQEVSIRSEKQALERLSGHPVLTELRGSGVFRVGGHTHEYIVMDLATGRIVEDMVLELAESGEYLPELETLVIMDRLLDLLAYAHDKRVIYNDVDTKHLFWDRTTYRLKVIDWGNAVFLDEPGALPTVSRASDIYQCGELLYFILTGGKRLVTDADTGDTFYVNFGSDAERIPAKLQAIITRAVHPDPKRRYGSMTELRSALAEYRQPIEKTRDEIVSRVRKRVRATASQEELEELAESLRVALDMDPGFPDAVALAAEIQSYLKQIRVQADLDAIRIYLESGNWPRALSLLHDLLPGVDAANQPLVEFLIGATATLETLHISPPPAGFLDALDALFQGKVAAAGQALLNTPESRASGRQAQWLLAEQLATAVPDVILLRPHLARLRHDLTGTPGSKAVVALLDEIDDRLARAPLPGLAGLRVIYEQIGEMLGNLEQAVSALARSAQEQEAAISSVIHTQHAAREIVERLAQVGQFVICDPSRAGDLLHQAHLIDPTSPHFEALHDYFDEVHQAMAALAQFKPKGEGGNLAGWFTDVQEFLEPYLNDLPDPQLHAAAAAVEQAAQGWTTVLNYLALGRRQPTIDVLHRTADTIRPFNEQLAAWLGTLATRLADATHVERYSPNTKLADLLIDGWKMWDQGKAATAAEIGRQARDYATTDGERLAADRLRRLGELLDGWLADEGTQDRERTDRAETEALMILLSEEEQERRTFAEQMPNTSLYLRAMSRGIVAYMHQSSSAGWRALYMHYVLRGMLALLDENLEEADFWRNAAGKAFDDARTHRAFQVLDRALTGRKLVQTAEKALNAVSGPKDLEIARQAINAPLAGEWLAGAEQAVYETNEALRHWSDGDFHAARQSLESALTHIQQAVEEAGLRVEPFVQWLTSLHDVAAELQQQRLILEKGALSTSEEPDPALAEAHNRIVTLTMNTLGPDYAHQVRQWDDMYQAVLETYTTQRLSRREKLAAFSRHFASLFISKHPVYPLFRHWESVIEQLPPDEVEDDVIEVEPETDEESVAAVAYLEDDREPEPVPRRAARAEGELPWNKIIAVAALVLVIAVVLAIVRLTGQRELPAGEDEPTANDPVIVPPAGQPTRTPRPTTLPTAATSPTTLAAVAVEPTTTPTAAASPFVLPTAAPTQTPSATPTPEPTEAPSLTPTEVIPPTPTFVTPTLRPVNTPILVASPISVAVGPQTDVLAALADLPADDYTWDAEAFQATGEGRWRLATGGSQTLRVELPPALLNAALMPGAAASLARADVVFKLVEYDEQALANGEIAFGLGAQNGHDQAALVQVQFERDLLNLGLNQNGQFSSRTRIPLSNPELQLRLSVRRYDPTTLAFYVDEKLLGNPVIVYPQKEPLTLLLVVTGRNVVVEVSEFRIDVRPGDDLP